MVTYFFRLSNAGKSEKLDNGTRACSCAVSKTMPLHEELYLACLRCFLRFLRLLHLLRLLFLDSFYVVCLGSLNSLSICYTIPFSLLAALKAPILSTSVQNSTG